jgi:hypothetical protein
MPRFIRFPASAFTAGVLNTGAQTGTVFDGLSGTGDNDVTYRLVNADNVSPEFMPEAAVVNAITHLGYVARTTFVGAPTDDLTVDLGGTAPAMLVVPFSIATGPGVISSIRLDPAGANLAPTATHFFAGEVGNGVDRSAHLAMWANPGLSGNRVIRVTSATTINRWAFDAFNVTGWTTMGTPVAAPFPSNTNPWTLNINTTAGRGLLVAGVANSGRFGTFTTGGVTEITDETISTAGQHFSGTSQSTTTSTPLTITRDFGSNTIGGMFAVEFS